MLYLQQSLGERESLIQVGRFHWMYTFFAVLNIFWGLAGALIVLGGSIMMFIKLGTFPPDIPWTIGVQALHPAFRLMAFVVFLLGVFAFAHHMVIHATTEIAVTNSRLLYKRGLVARAVYEIAVNRIESTNVIQGILGRILDYGVLVIKGTGVGEIDLPPIEHPIAFKKAIDRARGF
jgi:uncharacterized membrane protein YdbT with pleckstrin-like domain